MPNKFKRRNLSRFTPYHASITLITLSHLRQFNGQQAHQLASQSAKHPLSKPVNNAACQLVSQLPSHSKSVSERVSLPVQLVGQAVRDNLPIGVGFCKKSLYEMDV